ncbi:geranylgeranyl pyrophosphate synthetase, partial [Colletotrichum incanum]
LRCFIRHDLDHIHLSSITGAVLSVTITLSMPSVVAEISHSDLGNPPICDATITDLQHVASYNWLDKTLPTILVPGAPPLWSPPPRPPTMMPDSGTVYIDQNAARSHYPLEPLLRALLVQNPKFELGDIDLVTDRNNIRKLLRFVQKSSSDPFEIQVEIAGSKTALFTRVETKTKDTIQGFRGFGHNFEKAYTKGLVGSTGHHRIVHYHFGGLKFIIRHETDGYVDNKDGSSGIAEAPDVADNLSDLLGAVSISETREPARNMPVTVAKTKTAPVNLASTIEIKTRAASRTLDMIEVAPQLWISQTPILVVAYHRNRVFSDVRLRNVKQDIHDWEVANQTVLQKLAFLIKKICTAVKSSGNRSGVVRYDGTKLKVTSGEQKRALPLDLYSLWDVKKQR